MFIKTPPNFFSSRFQHFHFFLIGNDDQVPIDDLNFRVIQLQQTELRQSLKLASKGEMPLLPFLNHRSVQRSLQGFVYSKNGATVFLAVGANTCIIKNINTKLGSVNGSTGIVKNFFYRDAESAPRLPYAVICDIKDYLGPPFFNGLGRDKWIPIKTYKASWGDGGEKTREQYPIALSWGVNPWKVQGSTFRCPIVIDLGVREMNHGISYVLMSRATD